jgi:acyl carrier protein
MTAAGTAKTKLTTTTLSVVKHSPGGTIFRAEVGPFYTPISIWIQRRRSGGCGPDRRMDYTVAGPTSAMTSSAPLVRSDVEIRKWLVANLAAQMELEPGQVDPEEPIAALGIDSMQLIGLIGDLEEWLGCRFTDNPWIDFPTVNSLSAFVAAQLKQGRTTISSVAE